MNQTLQLLLINLSVLQIGNVIISSLLYYSHKKNKLYLFSIFMWIGSLCFTFINYLHGSATIYLPLISLPFATISAITIGAITCRLYNMVFKMKPFIVLATILYVLSFVFYLLNINSFILIALPISLSIFTPVLYSIKKVLSEKRTKSKLHFLDWIYFFIITIWGVHYMDYPFLRPLTSIEFSIFGFSFALLLLYIISILIPVLINTHFHQKMTSMLDQQLYQRTSKLKQTQAKSVAHEKLASLGTLTSGIAHELRNPLHLVSNSSSIVEQFFDNYSLDKLKAMPNEDEETQAFFEQDYKDISKLNKLISSNIKRMNSIINMMLSLSKRDTTRKSSYNLSEIVKTTGEIVLQSHPETQNTLVDILYELNNDLMVYGNQGELNRIFLNLFENSFYSVLTKARILQDHYKPIIKISAEQNNMSTIITFEDNGIGIPEENRKRVLEPFFTTKQGKEGTGLGLSIVYDIITEHSGHIEIESEENYYCRIIITLPNLKDDYYLKTRR